MKRTIILLAATLIAVIAARSQECPAGEKCALAQGCPASKECPCAQECPRDEVGKWEISIGGSALQFNRVGFSAFSTTDAGHYIDMQLRHAVFGGNISLVRRLSDKWAADIQGTVGTGDRKLLAMAGLGLQWRLGSYFNSKQIDPYLRVGGNYLYKGFDILYGGSLNGMEWDISNVLGGTADARHLFAVSGGMGVNMWLNKRFGIGIQGDYLLITQRNVANSIQGTARLMWRF
ncbi:MAG: hypothetical protein LBV32_00165 [Tannerellaceae bacterium]|jgi:hypothetical protein|nr:hypothetical protein [Tannerellaceae bacterium]